MNITLIGFIKKELRQTLRDPRMRFILFLVPIIQMTLFGVALSTEVKNIRLGVFMEPDDTVAADVYRDAIASGWFLPARTGIQDPFRQIQSGDADAVLVAPPGWLTRSIGRGGAQLQLLINAENPIQARSVDQYMQQIFLNVLRRDGLDATKTSSTALPLQLDVRLLYNPSLRSAIFMVPGVMSMIVCVLTILLTSMALAREKEIGTFEMLISAPIQTWEIIAGKTLPYFILGLLDVPVVLLVAILVFDVPIRGPLWELGLASIAFVGATVCIGMLISTFAKNQQQAMLGGFLFLLPAILLSGIMFSVDNMPLWLKLFVYANPLTYFAALLRNILLKGGDPYLTFKYVGFVALSGAAALWISFRRFRHTIQ